MSDYKKVTVDISPSQLRSAAKGKKITLSASQLKGGSASFYVHPENADKISKAVKANKGTRIYISRDAIKHDIMQGGSLWNWLKSSLWPAIKPAVSGVLDAAVAPVSTALGPYGTFVAPARGAIKQLTGVGIKPAKGSAEMKQHMANLRARRGKTGASFKL